ncbi:MAG: YggT family protein [Alphaproteobacteria bacterium]|nr:YggT family protein [Pseudomonadota bacterium]
MHALATLIDTVISIYIYVLIASALMSWLTAFNIINVHNRFVFTVISFLYRVTEPALRPIRRIIPNLGGVDISPVVLILVLWFVRDLILEYLFREV